METLKTFILVIAVLIGPLSLTGCDENHGTGPMGYDEDRLDGEFSAELTQDIKIPREADWVDHGVIFSSGSKGAWDRFLWGGFTGTVVKKDGTFFLYYQGAKDYSDKYGTVTYRTLGVATSRDGLNFSKYRGNPVLTWFPNNWLEEGVVSGGATVDASGNVALYYGANTKISNQAVSADGRLAMSSNGLGFKDLGIALDRRNTGLWGSGDEIFPITSIQAKGNWYVYYIPNGTSQRGKLGVAWGPEMKRLRYSKAATADGQRIDVWGMGGYARVGTDTYALFLSDVREASMEVRIVHLNAPNQLSTPVRRYSFNNFSQGTIYLDEENKTWYMFYRDADAKSYRVKTAPVVKGR